MEAGKVAIKLVHFSAQFIYIDNLKTEPPVRHFKDQITEATNSKFGSDVLYSIRMKMGIIKKMY